MTKITVENGKGLEKCQDPCRDWLIWENEHPELLAFLPNGSIAPDGEYEAELQLQHLFAGKWYDLKGPEEMTPIGTFRYIWRIIEAKEQEKTMTQTLKAYRDAKGWREV